MKLRIPSMLSACLLAGCAPRDNAPPGFIDACYGGREHMARNWVMSDTRMELTVEAGESEWPRLRSIVKGAGEQAGLRVFDTSNDIPDYIRTPEVHVCDPSGIFLSMDKRVYSRKQPGSPPDDRIVTTLRTYDRSANWQPLAEAVQAGFREKFGAPFTVSFPPLNNVPLSKMALPDNVRAELQSECRAAKAGQRAYYCDPE